MNSEEFGENFSKLILSTLSVDEERLILARKRLLKVVQAVGAKNFVTLSAQVLKNNFQIEGCNDLRIPLKRIFSISLDELEGELLKKEHRLPNAHPLVVLSQDHQDNLKQLKRLRFSLGRVNLNQDTSAEAIKEKQALVKDYYLGLDLHIRKEEEVLFPLLEKAGMQEHPESLRQEHQGFRDILSRIGGLLDNSAQGKPGSALAEIKDLKEKFISEISNHIFRETYVFYPASLEFIKDTAEWEKIKAGFSSLTCSR